MITLALDCMGADAGAEPLVAGAARLSREDPDVRMVLVGEPELLRRLLRQYEHAERRVAILGAEGCVEMGDSPAEALEARPRCSVLEAARFVAAGEAQALVSAGNTGALVLAASRNISRLPGIRRSALAAVHPTEQRHGPRGDPFALILDVGATLTCTAEDLVGFALMGSAWSKVISDVERPRVALLSNGTEPHKGTPVIVEAHERLRRIPGLNFVGNVEGLDIPRGTVEVVVTEGFLGNVVLKMLEGVAEVMKDLAKQALDRGLLWKIGLGIVQDDLRQLRDLTDWKQYGGAPLLGLERVVVKAHGRSNARAVRNALKVAARAARRDLAGEIARGMEGGP